MEGAGDTGFSGQVNAPRPAGREGRGAQQVWLVLEQT